MVTRLRDAFSALYEDEDFRKFHPARGQPGLAPWRLALVMVFQFLEHLSDRQAADAVRARVGWKYALGLAARRAFRELCMRRCRWAAGATTASRWKGRCGAWRTGLPARKDASSARSPSIGTVNKAPARRAERR